VQKAQASKLENSLTAARFRTTVKVFKALSAQQLVSIRAA
jgi:hypothetical protein